MNWTNLLSVKIEASYHATEGLMALVTDDMLSFKPETGSNWMTTGQLLKHISIACGFCMRGFVTGDWGSPDGEKCEDMPPEEMLPPAEKMPTVETVAQAVELLAEDKKLAFEMLAKAGEEELADRMQSAPWNPAVEYPLGRHLLGMVGHLEVHKAQLFFYLKLSGKPVHTGNLWGM
jgi:DinB family protein